MKNIFLIKESGFQYNLLSLLNETIANDVIEVNENENTSILSSFTFKDIFNSLKQMLYKIKDIGISFIKGLKLDQIGLAILSILRSIPLLNRIIPNQTDKEKQVKEIIGTISIGNGVTKVMNIMQYCIAGIWNLFPIPTNWKEGIKGIFDYNDAQSFLQTLYKLMLDANIEPRHANAFLMVIAMKIPIYNLLYKFKPFGFSGNSNPTTDDQLHPWTSGDPIVDPETGLNETEKKLQSKVQKFIQIKKQAEIEETDNSLDLNTRLNRAIIKEAIIGFIAPFTIHFLQFFKICFGVSDDSLAHKLFDYPIYILIWVFFIYFLVTGLILAALAIDNEESFNPSTNNNSYNSEKEKEDISQLAVDGTIDFHQT